MDGRRSRRGVSRDLLDNNRRGGRNGRCAHEGSQFEILDALLSLKRQALKTGGRGGSWETTTWNVSWATACAVAPPKAEPPRPRGVPHLRPFGRVLAHSSTPRPEYMKKAKVVAVARVNVRVRGYARPWLHGRDTEALVRPWHRTG